MNNWEEEMVRKKLRVFINHYENIQEDKESEQTLRRNKHQGKSNGLILDKAALGIANSYSFHWKP